MAVKAGKQGTRLVERFATIALADAGQAWAQVLRVGRFSHPQYGEFEVTPEQLATMVRNFREGVRPKAPTRLAVDYNHESGGKAAGWISGLETRAGGTELWALVEWTEEAAAAIAAKAFQFTSAEFAYAYQDKENGSDRGPTLLGMAVTNRPFVEGMAPLSLSEKGARAVVAALPVSERPRARVALGLSESRAKGRAVDSPGVDRGTGAVPKVDGGHARVPSVDTVGVAEAMESGEGDVSPRGSRGMEPKEILAILGLSEGTDALAAVRQLHETSRGVTAERDQLKVQLTEATTERDALKLRLAEANRDALIAKYEGEGKLTPAMRDGWAKELALKDADGFVRMMETMPKVVEFGERGSAGDANAGTVQLTEAERTIAKQLGLSEADVLKSKQAAAGQ